MTTREANQVGATRHDYGSELQALLSRLPQIKAAHKGSGPREGRVAEQIRALAEKQLSQGQIAQRVGCRREYVQRVLKRGRKAVGA